MYHWVLRMVYVGTTLVGWRVESEDFLQLALATLAWGGGSLKGDSEGVIR